MKKYILPFVLLLTGILLMLLSSLFSHSKIDFKIKPAAFIMPAAYKVYRNPNVAGGRYHLFSAIIKNSGSAEINNLRLQYRVPKFIDDWIDVPAPATLLPGQEVVVTCFPVFNQAITMHKTLSKEKAEIRFFYGNKSNPTEKDESFVFDMTSVNDIILSDTYEKGKVDSVAHATDYALYACIATSQDPVIKYYASKIMENLSMIPALPYVSDSELVKENVQGMKDCYQATVFTKIVHTEISACTSPSGNNTTAAEHICLPREVVLNNAGSSTELALLQASLLKVTGHHTIIFITPGHVFPGIKSGNDYYAIEAAGIGGAGNIPALTASQAYQQGMKEAKDFFAARQKGLQGYYLVDLAALDDEGYKEIELTDDPLLLQKVDELTKGFRLTAN